MTTKIILALAQAHRLEGGTESWRTFRGAVSELVSERDKNAELVALLGAEIVALRLDAERYQWLRDESRAVGYPSGEGLVAGDAYLVITGYDDDYMLDSDSIDATVDNEIAKHGAKE